MPFDDAMAVRHGYPVVSGEPLSDGEQQIAMLKQMLHEARDQVATLTQQLEAARGCSHGDDCACAIGSRHSWLDAFSAEREKVATLTQEREQFRVQVEERYGAVAQWQAEAETNRQAWQKAEASLAALADLVQTWRDPEFWKNRGSAMDAKDCADELEARLREPKG